METGKDLSQRHFDAARRRAFWNEARRFLTGRSNRLLSWREVQGELHLHDFVEHGHEAVPLDRIVGSVGRYNEFDRAFMPKLDSTAPRWRSVARAVLTTVRLPPVTLYRVSHSYFVVDGHHRVSVANELGRAFVDARVIEAVARIPLPTHLDADHLQIAREHTHFLECVRLDVLRPDQDVTFTTAGAYRRATDHVALHRRVMRKRLGRPVAKDQAVGDWYDHVYLPVVRIIREEDMFTRFPRRTEGDLFLWIADHQHALSQQCGLAVSEKRAAEHLVGHHAAQLLKRLLRGAREWFAGPDCALLAD